MGEEFPQGDVDIFFNGKVTLQPGCMTASCAHARVYKFYAGNQILLHILYFVICFVLFIFWLFICVESVRPGNENCFMARECSSITSLDNGYCKGPLVPVGYAIPLWMKGNLFLRTNAEPPYGKNCSANEPVCAN